MDIPVFKCVIDESVTSDLEVNFVALVDRPAIEKNFLSFKAERMAFSVDTDRRIISGPAMLADTLIYRRDDTIGEYYTTFDKQSIFSIVQKFFKKGYGQNFNIMHDADQQVTGVTIFESFITDEGRGVLPMKGFEEAPDGSWFLSARVDDDGTWEKIKAGDVKGFSVEGLFRQVPLVKQEYSLETALEAIVTILQKTNMKA